MNYWDAYKLMWQRGFNFRDRATRPEYWWVALVNAVVIVVLIFLEFTVSHELFAAIYDVYVLLILVPDLALCVRRLHDTDRSGWWVFIGLIPILGGLVLIWFLAQPSSGGSNRFGEPSSASRLPLASA